MNDDLPHAGNAVAAFTGSNLLEHAEHFRIILENIGDGVLCTDASGMVVFSNPAAEQLTGWSREQAIGRHITESFVLTDESTRELLPDLVRQAIREKRVMGVPKWTGLHPREGRPRLIEDTVAPIFDHEGKAMGAVLVFHDVTDLRKEEAERERLLSEVELARENLHHVFDHSPSFMAVLRGPQHVFELANHRYQELVGSRDVIGRPVREALPELVGQGFLQLLDRAYETGKVLSVPEASIKLRRGDSAHLEERFLEFIYQPMRDSSGEVSGILVQGVDVTDRKRAEHAAATTSERLKLLIAHATDYALIVTDPESRILEWTGGAEHITGWTSEEMLGESSDRIFVPEDRESGAAELERLTALNEGRAEDKRWHLRKDGTRFFGDGVMTSLWSANGELKGFGKVVRDVTERKLSEEQARQADQRKDEFIALLAHELRNPLAPIRSGLQVIRLAQQDPEAVEQARAMMDRQLGHMVRLIDDLLDVSRISQNKMELRRSQVLLADIVAHAVETSRPVIAAAGHRLTVALPEQPVTVDADLTRLAQVLSNLLTNSAKYTDRGGDIRVEARIEGDNVTIAVKDNGVGIPTDALPHVFDMFSQAGASMERSRGGLGIGLALVRGLVEMHGGSVSAESGGAGAGSTFTVRLPAVAATREAQAVKEQSWPDGPHIRTARILVVDDNVDAARTMARVLTLLGNEVQTAHDGVEALEAAEAQHPDVILMDIAMPRMNGYDATRQIRERPWGTEPVIVALTGWGLEGDRERSREAGCDGHLVKPVELGDLEAVVDSLMARRADREAARLPSRR